MTGPRVGDGPVRPDHPVAYRAPYSGGSKRHLHRPGQGHARLFLSSLLCRTPPALQAAEDALLAMVVGTRPAVTPAMVRLHLLQYYGIAEVSVWRTRPGDFIVRFTNLEDLDTVLGTPSPEGAPFALR